MLLALHLAISTVISTRIASYSLLKNLCSNIPLYTWWSWVNSWKEMILRWKISLPANRLPAFTKVIPVAIQSWLGNEKQRLLHQTGKTDQTYSCPRDYRHHRGPIEGPSNHQSTIELSGFRGALKWAPRDASLSDSCTSDCCSVSSLWLPPYRGS